MKEIVSLNKNWKFYDFPYNASDKNKKGLSVNLPHTVKEEPVNYFDEKSYQFVSHYIKHFNIENISERYLLRFDGVMNYCKVILNGNYLGEHKGGFTTFRFEITDFIKFGDNELIVEVDSTERSDIPPFGFVVDYITYGGIYRDVDLLIADSVFISNVKADGSDCLGDKVNLDIQVDIDSVTDEIGNLTVLLKDGETEISEIKNINVKKGKNKFDFSLSDIKNIELWDLDNPKLYNLKIKYNSETSDSCFDTRIGFRKALFTKDGFYLNGKKIKILGLNRHQDFPVIGYAAPKRIQQKDADILKNELSLNTVRTSHYPQSKYFLDRCDEIGLMVFEETPGWQYLGDKEWQEVVKQNVAEMIENDYNHPSVILWGVRVNESEDCDELYKETNRIAHSLDKSRQTGGVRRNKNSKLFEDVYTYNDFSFDGKNTPHQEQKSVTGLKCNVPYLITEFCGHTHPTKSYDQEERSIEYGMRFAKIMNSVFGDDNICGAIGWCAFDYHTHFTFGSGDRICYHGVMDMFRLPKIASYFFKSQKSPKQEAVLEPATRWTVGDRDGGGLDPLIVYTNCDYVTVKIHNKDLGVFYPDKENFNNLDHPPICIHGIDVFWGGSLGDAVFKGYIDGKCAVVREFTSKPVPAKLIIEADDKCIDSDGTDMTRIVVKVVDQKNNILPYLFTPISFEIDGGADIIGPETVSTIGGVYAIWIKSNGKKEKVRIKATTNLLLSAECTVDVK